MGSEWGTINMVLNKGHNLPLICNEDILIKGGAHNGVSSAWSYGSWIYSYLCNQVFITTDVVSLNLDQGELYNIMW